MNRPWTRREFLLGSAGAAIAPLHGCLSVREPSAPVAGSTPDPVARLIRLEVALAVWVRRNRGPILQAPPDGTGEAIPWSDYGFKWPAYTLAHLWSTAHPDNPLYGDVAALELAKELYDKEVACWLARRGRGGSISTYETPHYVAAFLFETLGGRLEAERRARWLEHENAWVAQALTRPLGQTGRYHDSWRFTALYRLGQALRQPAWSARGVELFREMLRLQTDEGFWLEQRGPSARYHGLMLPSLAWMYRWTGDDAFRRAAERLAKFLTTFIHPDGLSVGAFDVRNCTVPAYFPTCAGLELTAEGRAFGARAFRLWDDLGQFEDVTRSAPSTRDLPRMAFYAADTCRYLSLYARGPGEAAAEGPLPVDRDGVLEHHSPIFDGLLARRGPWVIALSGHRPVGPRESRSPYMLDGQSRIELWHSKARLLAGGGHSHREWPVPLANVFLPASRSDRSEFGRVDPGQPGEARAAAILPKEVSTGLKGDVPELVLTFDLGTVRFRVLVGDDRRIELEADWDVRDAARLCLQVPLVVWGGARVLLDGSKVERGGFAAREIRREIRVEGSRFGAPFTLGVPEGVPCRVHFPIDTGQFHDGPWRADPVRNPFDLALVSSQWTAPERTGRAAFRFTVTGS